MEYTNLNYNFIVYVNYISLLNAMVTEEEKKLDKNLI